MKLVVNALYPNGHISSFQHVTTMVNFDAWLQTMVRQNNDLNFFFTTETTDIFDDYDYGNYDFSRVKVLERYRGHTITTRLDNCGSGCRVYLPQGGGLLNFAPSIFHAKALIDERLQEDEL